MKTLKQNFIWEFIKDFNPAVRFAVLLVTSGVFACIIALLIGLVTGWGSLTFSY